MTTTQTTPSSLQTLSLAAIVESTFNPRKTFDAAKLQELADSIKAQGLLQPILVRPLPGSRVATTGRGITHEVVAGARRYRACQLAGLNEIMAVVCTLSDTAAMEAALIENLQRDDLSELEEAEGYAALCSMSNITKDELASKIHRSTRYIFNRLKLLKLQPLALTALRTGQIDATTALQIATVHDGDLQAKALKFATSPDFNGDKPSTRILQTWMRNNVMLALNRAPFDINNITLRPSAGACTACPKRTGADPDLFADTTGPDSCCDAPCYHAKAQASREQALAKYARQGIRVILADNEDADEYDIDDYSPVSQTREDTTSGQPTTLLDLLGKQGQAEVGLVAFEDGYTKEIKVYVNDEKAEAWLLAKGLIVPDAEPTGSGLISSLAYKLQDLKRRKDMVVERAGENAVKHAIEQAVLKAESDSGGFSLISNQLMQAALCATVNHYQPGIHADIFDCHRNNGEGADDYQTRLLAAINAATQRQLNHAMALEMLNIVGNNASYGALLTAQTILYNDAADVGAETLADINALAQHDAAKDIEAQIAELEAKLNPPKTKPTQSPAGAAKPSARKDSKPAQPKPAKPPKLSAKQAQSGIADAMQSAEEVAANAAVAQAPATQTTPAFTPGQHVKVLATTTPWWEKHVGKTGKIIKPTEDGSAFDVRVSGGIAEFLAGELEAA